MKRRVLVFVSVTMLIAFAIVVLGSQVLSLPPAHAQGKRLAPERSAAFAPQPLIPGNQGVCTFSLDTFNPGGPPGLPASAPATINLAAPSNVKVTFSAESQVFNPGDILGVSYLVDGNGPFIFGPEFFASNIENFESHTQTELIGLPAGAHTIQPYAYVYGANTGQIFFRCLTLEGNTN